MTVFENVIKKKRTPHIPIPRKGLNFGFTHQCAKCGAYYDGKIWSWDLAPAEDYCKVNEIKEVK